MKKFSLYTHHKKILTDTITPVTVYYKIRDKYPNSILLESGDYHKVIKTSHTSALTQLHPLKLKMRLFHKHFLMEVQHLWK